MKLSLLVDFLGFLGSVATQVWDFFSKPDFFIGLAAAIVAFIVAKAIFS